MGNRPTDRVSPNVEPTRRDFLGTATAVTSAATRKGIGMGMGMGMAGLGFAAAALPVIGQTLVHTDAAGLTAGMVAIPVGGSTIPAYRAVPEGRIHVPMVLVVSEVFGLHEHIADLTRRLARRGYYAIAPDLFVRQGDAKAVTDIPTLIGTIVDKASDAQVLGDLDATVAWAGANGADATKLAVTGFCWGGRITWLFNAHNPAVKAAAAWYGPLVGPAGSVPNDMRPKHPIDITATLHGPTLGLYGGADVNITAAHVRRMRDALAEGDAAAQRSEIIVYPDTPHAFNADYRASYRKGPADDAWRRMLAWFKTNGVA